MNDIKDALSRAADSGAPAPLGLDAVRGRARRIRRRRTATALVGSAAAVAAIAGLGVAVMPSGSHDDSVPPATQTPSPTPTAADPDAVGRVFAVALDGLDAEQTSGAEPGVPYWSDGEITDTDGSVTPLPERPLAFAKDSEKGGWVVVEEGEALAELVRISDDGTVTDGPLPTFPGGLAVGHEGQLATLTQETGGWWLRASGHGLSRQVGLGRGVESAAIAGFRADGDVVVQVNGAFRVADTITGQVSDLAGAAVVPSSALPLTAVGGDDGTWTATTDDGSTAWTLDWSGVSSFDPSGTYVALAGDPQDRIPQSTDWDSEATSTLWIRDASTLAPVAAFVAPENAYFWAWAWEGDQLIADVYDRDTGQWSLVRLSAEGFTVLRGASEKGRGEEPAYVFAEQ